MSEVEVEDEFENIEDYNLYGKWIGWTEPIVLWVWG